MAAMLLLCIFECILVALGRALELKDMRGAGGTPGGVGEFLVGLGLVVVGGYLFMQQVIVTSGGWRVYGYDAFGLSLVRCLLGLGIVFYNGKSILGWFLVSAGILIMVAGIIANLRVHFASTSLYNTLIMLGMIAVGVGLVARSVRDHGDGRVHPQKE